MNLTFDALTQAVQAIRQDTALRETMPKAIIVTEQLNDVDGYYEVKRSGDAYILMGKTNWYRLQSELRPFLQINDVHPQPIEIGPRFYYGPEDIWYGNFMGIPVWESTAFIHSVLLDLAATGKGDQS